MANYIQDITDLSNNFTLSNTIPNGSTLNGSIFKTGFEINYNGTFYDIAQVYNNFTTKPMPYDNINTPYKMHNFNYLSDINNIPYDIGRLIYNNNFIADYLGISAQNGINGQVYAMAVSGTNVYVGGSFTTAGGISAVNIAKLNGSTWSPLGDTVNNGTSAAVSTINISGTNVYVGGSFNAVSSSTQTNIRANYIAKWNTIDSTWSALGTTRLGATTNNRVTVVRVSGTKIYVGGEFTTVSSSTQLNMSAKYIAIWDGSTWSALGTGPNGTVHAIAISGTNLYVGGNFTTAGIAKWDGSTWSNLGTGPNGVVYAIAILGTDVYVGGSFTTVGGTTSAINIAKWNINNSTWSNLGIANTNGTVYAITILGTDVYVGGSFTTIGGISASRIAKLNGSTWSNLGIANSTVNAIAILGTDVYVGGSFTTIGGTSANRIAKLNGSTWSALGAGFTTTVNAIEISGTNVYVGGLYTTPGGQLAINIAKWNTIDSTWSALGTGLTGRVNAIAISGTNVYVGGEFSAVSSIQTNLPSNNIAIWNESNSTWSDFVTTKNGTNNPVKTIKSDNYGNVYVGGLFTELEDSTQTLAANYFAIWNGSWNRIINNAYNGPDGLVNTIQVTDTNIYVGGLFTKVTDSFKSIFVNNIFKL